MPSRPVITLMLLTRQRVYRADFRSLSRPPEITERERPDASDLPSVVEAVLSEGGLPGKRTFVLATDFWLQTASLPASRAIGLNDDDIARGLNFEAEVLSGLPALDAVAGIVPLPQTGGERRYLLLQIPTGTREGIERVLVERGSQLAGLVHPAALPRSENSLWPSQRIELWPDVAIGIRPVGDGHDVHVSNADPETNRWPGELAEWAGADVLLGPGVNAPTGVKSLDLTAPDRLAAWFTAWASELSTRRPRTAMVRTPVRPISAPVKAFATLAITVAVAAAVYAHWSFCYLGDLAELKARTSAARDKTKQLADLQAREAEAKKKGEAAAQEAAKFDRFTEQIEAHQARFSRLLVVLASEKPADVMIRKIEAVNGEPKVVGTSMRPELADAFARALTPAVRLLGWEIQPPHKTALKLLPDGGPWTFEMAFHRIPDDAAPRPKPAAKRPGSKAPPPRTTASRGDTP